MHSKDKQFSMGKLFALFLSLLLSATLLGGCSATAEKADTDTSSAPVAVEQQETDNSGSSEEAKTSEEADKSTANEASAEKTEKIASKAKAFDIDSVPEYSGSPYCEVNGNKPTFTKAEKKRSSFEEYSDLDSLGRCGTAFALVGTETMPTEERGSIGMVKPTGWHLVKYDNVDGKYLYNRCHLIGYQLTGENANVKNLITGTRYLNVTGMLPFENEIADYVESSKNHVLYRVTPVFEGDNLLADGVHMEAYSVEDSGKGVSFNVFCYNVQPAIVIDYATGDNHAKDSSTSKSSSTSSSSTASSSSGKSTDSSKSSKSNAKYVLNTNTKKFHDPGCPSASDIKSSNKQSYSGKRADLVSQGYAPCKRCNP